MNKRLYVKTTFKQKIKLVILGIFLFFIILEVSLRISGFVVFFVQEWRNSKSLSRKPQYKILCLGESTTAIGGNISYPAQLERILNSRNNNFKFAVINKGVIGTKTKIILRDLENNLNKYKPDMVITMMGINDNDGYIIYGAMPNSRLKLLLGNLKLYKLFYLIKAHIEARFAEISADKKEDPLSLVNSFSKHDPINFKLDEEQEQELLNSIKNNPSDFNSYFKLGQIYMNENKPNQAGDLIRDYIKFNPKDYKGYMVLSLFSASQNNYSEAMEACNKSIELNPRDDKLCINLGNLFTGQNTALAEDLFKKALGLNPKNGYAYLGLGWCYMKEDNIIGAEEAFCQAIKINPMNDGAYAGLGWCYKVRFDSAGAERLFRKALKLNPKNDSAYAGLGWCYINRVELNKAEGFLKTAIKINPKSEFGYNGLGWIYLQRGDVKGAIGVLEKGLKLIPRANFGVYLTLGWYYINTKQYAFAEEAFLKALELNPASERPYLSLAKLYEEMGRFDLAKEYYCKTEEVRNKQDYSGMASNYLKIKETLDKKNIKFVCVQYPMRSLEQLENIFHGKEGIIFVDNEKIFKDAVKKEGYLKYFFDMFAGDFGHCTPKGNKLLAENIADAILKECRLN